MSELDLLEKAVLGTGGAAGVVLLLFKLISFIKKEQVGQAGDSAAVTQFKALQEQIAQCQRDNTELRAQFNIMDKKLHTQQRTITRMEMLLRQFSGLVQEHGIPVPAYMQSELEDLISPNEDKPVASTANNRRSTD